jgi:glycosyltransferase involved in cell wall biosynthesis
VKGAIFVSKITAKIWRPLCSKKVIKCIIPNAADTLLCIPKKEINEIPHILFAARLVKGKGALYLLKAVEILKKRGRKFDVTIMGKGAEKEEIIAFIKTHKLKKNVRYIGQIIGTKRFYYFTEADIFCAPYSNEAAPLAILEAISAGLPIVGFINESFKESLSQYPAKELLVKKSDLALADALDSLITNRLKIATIKEWCLTQRNNYSWSSVAVKTEEIYYKVLEQK